MRPPEWFVKALAILDPLCSIRRSVSSDHWVIERKAVIVDSEIQTLRRRRDRLWRWVNSPVTPEQKNQIEKNRKAWQNLADEVVSAEQQKRIICRPRWFDQSVYNGLCQCDFRRYGGFARYCTEMEQEEERIEAEHERQMSNKRKAMNCEMYDVLNFLERKKSDYLANRPEAEVDLKFALHGRHTQPGEGPLIKLTDF